MKIDIDLFNLLRLLGRQEAYFENQRIHLEPMVQDSPERIAANDAAAIKQIIETGVKDLQTKLDDGIKI